MSSLGPAMQKILEGAVQMAIIEEVPLKQNWMAFRAHLLDSCPRRFTPSMLEDERDLIYDYYYQHYPREEQLDTPPKSPKNEPESSSGNLETEHLTVDEEEKSLFSPTLDEEISHDKLPETLTIFVKQQSEWDSTGWDFCKEDDCFISTRIVNRWPLARKGDRTELTWRFYGMPKKTYRTWFIIIEDERMESDIMLGKNWNNVESQTRERSCCIEETEQPICADAPRKEEYSPVPQEFPGSLAFSDAKNVSEYEETLNRMRAKDAMAVTAMRLSIGASLNGDTIWPARRPVEDVKSVSSDSQGQGQQAPKRRSRPPNPCSDH